MHKTCGYTWYVIPSNFLKGSRCPKCSNRVTKTTATFSKEVYNLYKGEYAVADKYINAHTKIKMYHKMCNSYFYMSPHDFLSGRHCPHCATNHKKTNDEFLNQVRSLVGSEYTVLSLYTGAHEKVKIKHNKCGTIWSVSPSKFLNDETRCPHCAAPHGEKYISSVLNDLNVPFIYQKRFSGCADKYTLPFDFYVPMYNICIEYDGIQHYESVEYFGGDDRFNIRHKHDLVKNKYCSDNNIKLIRIPYTMSNDDISYSLHETFKQK